MIVVCEPQCKSFSHEKFNSGFLYGLRLAFPNEQIRFYGDISHIDRLKKMLTHDGIFIENIEYMPINFRTTTGIMRAIGYWRLLPSMLGKTLAAGADRIFFLSFNPEILFLLKWLKRKNIFHTMKFTLVLHGGFESVAGSDSALKAAAPILFPGSGIREKIRRTRISSLPAKTVGVGRRIMERFLSPWRAVSRRLFTEAKILQWRHSGDFHYICLSPHIMVNARQYVDVEHLNFHTVTLPTVFSDVTPRPENEFAKFAIFGYGDALALRTLLTDLTGRSIKALYEIRVIGMDNSGIAGFPNATCPSPGRTLERSEMESYVRDIDMFLILYDKSRYRLSCSGSILEALSYLKPVLHLDNDCVNTFNKNEHPVGLRCVDIHMLADKLHEIAENYAAYGPILDAFRQNMLTVRNACSIEQSVDALRASFTW